MNTRLTAFGEANLKGWRGRVARPVATAVSNRTEFSERDIRTVIGLAFFALSIYLLASTIRRGLRYDELNPLD
jgi:hypothetical protein